MFESWRAFYQSDLQSLWLLLVAPAVFLLVRAVRSRPPAARGVAPPLADFVTFWCTLFAAETLLDPLLTGPGVRALGWDGAAASAVMVLFVLLGDFRIFWLVMRGGGARGAAALRPALALTLAIPVFAYAANAALRAALADVPGQALWLLHETAFLGVALGLWLGWLPRKVREPARRRFLASVLLYAALYYLLWAKADVLILLGVEEGWGLRVLPNQLYYGFTVPFVWWRFFSAR